MRLLAACILTVLPAATIAAQSATGPKSEAAKARCPNASSHYAVDQDGPLKPRKLTHLPPATGYMAVYRTIDGCDAPMTTVEYRSGRKR